MRRITNIWTTAVAAASILFGAAAIPALAQGDPAGDPLVSGIPTIPPLDSILAVGVLNSPRVRGTQALQQKTRHELNREKKDWLDGVSVGAATTYGSFGNDLLTQTQTGVNVGITVRWSLFDLFGRGDAIGVLEQEIAFIREKEFEVVQDERADLISMHSDLVLAERLVAINGEAWQATSAHREMANAEFMQGDIPVSELARVTEISTKAHMLFETARVEYLKRYKQLENRVGVPLASFVQ